MAKVITDKQLRADTVVTSGILPADLEDVFADVLAKYIAICEKEETEEKSA